MDLTRALAIDDPRVVEANIGGRAYKFWMCRRAYRIARSVHGYKEEDPTQYIDPEDPVANVDRILLVMWIAHLPFDPTVSFDEFEVRFSASDLKALVEASARVLANQTDIDLEKIAKEVEEASKKDDGAKPKKPAGGK